MTVLRTALLLAVLATSTSGCFGRKEPATISALGRSVYTPPVGSNNTTPEGIRSKILPWSTDTLSVRVPFPNERLDDTTEERLSPGLLRARTRLAARDRAQSELTERLLALPAAEPVPGSPQEARLGSFAESRPSLAAFLERGIIDAEEIVTRAGDRDFMELRLPLAKIAEAVINQGGGYSQDGPGMAQFGRESQAQREAIEQAQAEVLKQLLDQKIFSGYTVRDWVQESRRNRDVLTQEIRTAPTRRLDSGDEEEIRVVLNFNAREFIQRIREEEQDRRSRTKR